MTFAYSFVFEPLLQTMSWNPVLPAYLSEIRLYSLPSCLVQNFKPGAGLGLQVTLQHNLFQKICTPFVPCPFQQC